jgi:hypothetical protein
VAAGALDVGRVVVADVERTGRIDALLSQIGLEQRFALTAAVIAGGVEEIPGQVGTAGGGRVAPCSSRYPR